MYTNDETSRTAKYSADAREGVEEKRTGRKADTDIKDTRCNIGDSGRKVKETRERLHGQGEILR